MAHTEALSEMRNQFSAEAVQEVEADYAKAAEAMQPKDHDPYPNLGLGRNGNASKLFSAIADGMDVVGHAKAAEAMRCKADFLAIPSWCGSWASEVWSALESLWAG
ncbi:hypothetical protein LEL_10535 [Akanthomyces lecanii RCEF 1005]|uniref:Uncharacterized protein n=1 Tax=Akanthomyces lecanii RCEF 1005 TaxID=1081108 RepID=A0A167XKK1_CORDF|nr:hypothetical protein LEL_10535 [Akanthomyces lecanii RCEF 1005]